MTRRYLIKKDNKICYIECEKLNGITFKPLNSVFYDDGCMVAKIVIFKPEFIEYVLKKKIRNKLNLYLSIILDDASNDDGDEEYARAILYDLNKYKKMIMRRYKKYLDSKYLDMLLTKISILEAETKAKIDMYSYDRPSKSR